MIVTTASKTQTDLAVHARVVRAGIELVDRIDHADLTKPTPCADWTLHGLLTHMIAQHYGFAAAARGAADPTVWKPRPLGPDPAAEYRAAAEHVLVAFAEPGVLAREFPLVEFGPDVRVPGAQAVGFHLVDYVVHAWDVAKTLDTTVDFDVAALAAAHAIAAAVPGGALRLAPGAAFGPVVPWSDEITLDAIVARLGRVPGWSAATA
ncbi:TIGR03086 family metal-binding protein [Nocardia sp. NPDC127579]|uniref:TIGR03086 family metal-binding protein n=1 Tax=Nocardia sp. NPDC127579 TaxID=3345402 RepID=UPI0036404480